MTAKLINGIAKSSAIEVDQISQLVLQVEMLTNNLNHLMNDKVGQPVAVKVRQDENKPADLFKLASAIYNGRRRRGRSLPSELLGEPGWDILLDLFIHWNTNKAVSITSSCISAGVPPTTALRWITILENMELVQRYADTTDKRRSLLRLTGKGIDATALALMDIAKGL